MKKILLFLAIAMFAGLAAAQQTITQQVTANVVQVDVAYVYKSPTKVDINVVSALEDLGYRITFIKETNLPSNFDNYKFVYLGDERFAKRKDIKVEKFPTIISNYYHAYEWGLTDRDGVSQLGSTQPLSVQKNNEIIQVYTKAFKTGRTALTYYYLDKENLLPGFIHAASAQPTSSGSNFGDVITYINAGTIIDNGKTAEGNICFFGIVKSDYWTPAAEQMFKDCVNFVAG